MKRFLCAIAVVVAIAVPTTLMQNRALAQTPAGKAPDSHRALITTYCAGCHNTRLRTGGLALDGLNLEAAEDDAPIWEKVLRKLRGHQMPPGSLRPARSRQTEC